MTPRAAYVEEVRVRALRMMEQNRLQASDVAEGVRRQDGDPYSVKAIRNFLAGDTDFQTVSIAYAVARAHPEVAVGLPCPYCGHHAEY